MENHDPWFDMLEAADYIGRSEQFLEREVAAEKITNYKIGGLVRFRRTDLDEYLARAKRPAREDAQVQRPRTPTLKRRKRVA